MEFFVFLYNGTECDCMKIGKNDEYEVVIERQDSFGNGITKVNDIVVFVERALPGERVLIEIIDVRKKFINAKVREIKKGSLDRQKVLCPYYELCGGCQILHQDYSSQLKFKEEKVRQLFKKFANIDYLQIEKIHPGQQFYYRNKVVFHGKKQKLGFYQEKSKHLIPIYSCMLVEKEINQVYQKIQQYLEQQSEFGIEQLMIRKTRDGRLMLVLNGILKNKDALIHELKDFPIGSLIFNNQLLYGKESIVEEIFNLKFHIFKDAFFQVNYPMMLELYQIVIDYYREKRYTLVLDLYCGTGTIGMLITPYTEKVIGIEVVKDSIISANQNKKQNGISNIHFIEGKVEDKIELFQRVDSIIVDPPRSGLDTKTLQSILTINPDSITYISCNPATLARDLKKLLESYSLVKTYLVDMFPNTYHVECVCVLNRR